MAAFKVAEVGWADARFVMFGAGTAGTGIADQIVDAIVEETGKKREEAARQIWYVVRSCLGRDEMSIWASSPSTLSLLPSKPFSYSLLTGASTDQAS